jgi:glycosyltransferase involved in cell wall biosynthesis
MACSLEKQPNPRVPDGMRNRRRVLHVIQNLNYGGMERLVADMVRGADHRRFESHVLVLQYFGRFADGLSEFAALHLADPLPRWSMLWPASLIRQIRDIAPDVVHIHSGVWYKASLAARRARVPLVIHTEHGLQQNLSWWARFIGRLAARQTDVVVAVSDVLAEQLAATIVSDFRRIRVIRNGVDTERYRPCPDNGTLRAELGLLPVTPIIGSIGRLEYIKGYDVMIEALSLLRARWLSGPAPVVVVGGDGSERPRLRSLAERHGVDTAVHLLGWRDDIRNLHSAFSIFTLSSRSEGTSVSLLEAMSAGLCPVVTDVGGNAAILGDVLRHRLVPPENPAALAAAWLDALIECERRAADSSAARGRVVDAFGLSTMVRQYEALYDFSRPVKSHGTPPDVMQ